MSSGTQVFDAYKASITTASADGIVGDDTKTFTLARPQPATQVIILPIMVRFALEQTV